MTLSKKAKKERLDLLVRRIGEEALHTGAEVYAVGGYVRDRLLGRMCEEVDFVVVGNGPAFAESAKEKLRGRGLVVYSRFGTASFLSGPFKFEFVTARSESYESHSRNPIVEKSDLATDLRRRDFTVNAMAMAVDSGTFGEIIDPLGGREDLNRRVLRTPLDPAATFSDDPLRMMRAARFASQLQFAIDDAVRSAMKAERHRLEIVSQERITDEFFKILSHDKPSIGLNVLMETGILDLIFPELAALQGTEQRDEHHHKDVFDHTLKVVDNLARMKAPLNLRFAGLVHDIGKPKTKRFVEGTGWTFHGHELVSSRMLRQVAKRMKLSRDMARTSEKLTKLHMRPIQLIGEEVTDSAVRRLLVQAGDQIDDLMLLCRADITSGNPQRVEKHLSNFDYVAERMAEVEEKDRMRAFQSPVRGEEIMAVCSIPPGPMVGKLKKQIEEAILNGDIPNEHDAALAYLIQLKNRMEQAGGDL